MTYSEWLTAWVTILNTADAQGTAALEAIAPRAIEYAELRIYRDPMFDFLVTRDVSLDQMTTGGVRAVAIPPQFIVLEGVSLITPAGKRPTQQGAKRVPLTRANREYLDLIWPTETLTADIDEINGGYWAPFSMQLTSGGENDEQQALPSSILIAPTPNDVYIVEFKGTVRPAALSATNTETFLTTYMPDLFLAATLIFGFGYQRDFGGQSSDPQTAQSWEQQYQTLKAGVAQEELRKKALGWGFSPFIPAVPGVQRPQQAAQAG